MKSLFLLCLVVSSSTSVYAADSTKVALGVERYGDFHSQEDDFKLVKKFIHSALTELSIEQADERKFGLSIDEKKSISLDLQLTAEQVEQAEQSGSRNQFTEMFPKLKLVTSKKTEERAKHATRTSYVINLAVIDEESCSYSSLYNTTAQSNMTTWRCGYRSVPGEITSYIYDQKDHKVKQCPYRGELNFSLNIFSDGCEKVWVHNKEAPKSSVVHDANLARQQLIDLIKSAL